MNAKRFNKIKTQHHAHTVDSAHCVWAAAAARTTEISRDTGVVLRLRGGGSDLVEFFFVCVWWRCFDVNDLHSRTRADLDSGARSYKIMLCA